MPFRIEKMCAGRKPGLLRQHLTAVLAASEIGEADVGGAALGSIDLTFTPKTARAGEFHFAVGTAGSGTLVFQTTAFERLGVAAEKVADEVARQAGNISFRVRPRASILPISCFCRWLLLATVHYGDETIDACSNEFGSDFKVFASSV